MILNQKIKINTLLCNINGRILECSIKKMTLTSEKYSENDKKDKKNVNPIKKETIKEVLEKDGMEVDIILNKEIDGCLEKFSYEPNTDDLFINGEVYKVTNVDLSPAYPGFEEEIMQILQVESIDMVKEGLKKAVLDNISKKIGE